MTILLNRVKLVSISPSHIERWFFNSASNFLLSGVATSSDRHVEKNVNHTVQSNVLVSEDTFSNYQSYTKLVPLHFIPLGNQAALCLIFISQRVSYSHKTIVTGSPDVLRYILPLAESHLQQVHQPLKSWGLQN